MDAKELVEMISQKVPASVQIDMLRETYPQGVIRGESIHNWLTWSHGEAESL